MKAYIAKDDKGNLWTGTLSTDEYEVVELIKPIKANLSVVKVNIEEIV